MSTAAEDLPVPPRDQVDLSIEQWTAHCPDLDVSALNVFGRVHRIFQLYQAQISRIFTDHGINTASFAVLAALYRNGRPYRLTVGALAEQTLVSTGGMTMRLDRLEQTGLIIRQRDPVDRRVVYAQLTSAGVERARRVAAAHFGNETRLLHLLTPSERDSLAHLLRILETSIETADGSENQAVALSHEGR